MTIKFLAGLLTVVSIVGMIVGLGFQLKVISRASPNQYITAKMAELDYEADMTFNYDVAHRYDPTPQLKK